MAKQTKQLTPPRGIARVFFRIPIWLYWLGLGFVMGKRFVLLNHIGRRSGKPRQAVLEVVDYDPQSKRVVVCAGFGRTSQWYQNLLANPNVSIQLGSQKWDVTARTLTHEQGGEVFRAFCEKYPSEARFASTLGYEVDGTLDDYYDMGKQMTFVGLEKRG
jgi:deazaflavin-dependent oxidoreductase (nitroreductase family)